LMKQALRIAIAAMIVLAISLPLATMATGASPSRVEELAGPTDAVGPTGEVSINTTPQGCVRVEVFNTNVGLFGLELESPPNTCIKIVNITVNSHLVPSLNWECRRKLRLDPLFQPYLALEPGSEAEVRLLVIGENVSKECIVKVKIHEHTSSSGTGNAVRNAPAREASTTAKVYGWLGGTPHRISQHHRLKALAGSRGAALLVGSAWLVVVVKRICGS
jgi:hypothetical protein